MAMRMPLVDLAAVHEELGDELEAAVLRVCRSQGFIGGEPVAAFERDFAAFCGASAAVGVANGTAAIECVLRALEIGPGHRVLVPANSFIATAEAVSAVGADPVFVDADPETGLIDLDSARARVDERTRAVVPVHLYGRMCDMRAVGAFADEHGLAVIEDAAQAHGARRDGLVAGSAGRAGCFSFYPGKNLGAFGDAGAVTTNDADLAERIALYRDHGKRGDAHLIVGANQRLDALQAAVLNVKLPHMERWNDARRRVAARYRDSLPAEVLDWTGGADPAAEVHHLFPIMVDDRDGLLAELHDQGIAAGIHYRQAITETEAYRDSADPCPVAERRAARQLSLPIHPHLDDAGVDRIVAAIRGFTER
jgi:dTDP-4-amino-4,6-dideoxygalactose transaminase